MANCGRMDTDGAMVRAYRKPPSLFQMVHSLTLCDLHFLQIECANVPPGLTSRHVLPPGEYDTRYRQGSCVLCRMSL